MSRNKVLEALQGANEGRPPVIPPFQGTWAVENSELSLSEAIDSPEEHAKVQIAMAERCGFDGIEGMWDWLCMVEGLGAEVRIADGMGPLTTSHPLEDIDIDLEPSPESDLRGKSNLETMRHLEDSGMYIYSTVPGPFTLGGEMRGLEQLMMDMILEPEHYTKVLSDSTEVIAEYADFYSESSEGTLICESTGGPALLSPEDTCSNVLPWVSKAFNRVGNHRLLHISGDPTEIIGYVPTNEIDLFSAGDGMALDVMLDKTECAVLGGISAASLRNDGWRDEVRKQIINAMEESSFYSNKFIIGATSDISPDTPIEAVEIWRQFIAEGGRC